MLVTTRSRNTSASFWIYGESSQLDYNNVDIYFAHSAHLRNNNPTRYAQSQNLTSNCAVYNKQKEWNKTFQSKEMKSVVNNFTWNVEFSIEYFLFLQREN